jgi:hypothetical protein
VVSTQSTTRYWEEIFFFFFFFLQNASHRFTIADHVHILSVRRSNWPSIVISVFATNSEQEL